jgi:hypothetical protein
MSSSHEEEDRQRILQIVKRLLEQTRAGKLEWSVAGPTSYVYSTTSSSVTLSCRDGDDNYPYDVTVFNKAGAAVADLEFGSGDYYAEEVSDLYRLAGRLHLDVDGTLDTLLGELEDEAPF